MKSSIIWILCANYLSVLAQSVPEFKQKQDFINENIQDQLIQSQSPNALTDVQQRNYENTGNFNLDSQYVEPYNIEYKYHNYDKMTKFLRQTTAKYPSLTALYSIGKSVQGRDLWVMVVSASPYEHMIGKPDVKYVANMHGNEAVSRELMLQLIHHLVTSYSTDSYIRWLLDNTRIHIMPSMNPDGFEVSKEGTCDGSQGRYNARGFDLNRNFPDYFKQNNKRTQPETEAVKEWISKIQFVLSGSLHGGALVASYPFDSTPNSLFQSFSAPSLTPDDDVFKHLSLTYSTNHAKMSRGVSCKTSRTSFRRGITNGAEWYPLTGGMQDYNYVWYGCMEVTLEVSCCKYPPAHELPKYWEDNKEALIKFLAEAHRGVQGFVVDENGNPLEKASLKIKSRDVGFQTTKYGEFWRIVLPGKYKMEVYADGYIPEEISFVVVDQHPTLLNITLRGAKCISCGPGHTGQCFGPNICCGPFGCLMGSPETMICQREGLFHERVPCVAGTGFCRKNTGRCAAEGICCNQDACYIDRQCSADEKIKSETMAGFDFYNLLNTYPGPAEITIEK